MSVGGRVVEVVDVAPDRVWVNTLDGNDECAVYVDPDDYKIKIGDSLWWQCGKCYWTPRLDGRIMGRIDVQLKKIGYSGVPRPR